MNLIGKRKYFYTFSGALFVLSVLALLAWGLRLGIDFTGGSFLEIRFLNIPVPSNQEIVSALSDLELQSLEVRRSGDIGAILKFEEVDEETHQQILTNLNEAFVPQDDASENETSTQNAPSDSGSPESSEEDAVDPVSQTPVEDNASISAKDSEGNMKNVVVGEDGSVSVQLDADDLNLPNDDTPASIAQQQQKPSDELLGIEQVRFEAVGPVIGNELRRKSFTALLVIIAIIIVYIAVVFRHVSRPVASWKYGLIAVGALVHDIGITLGVFAVLGKFYGVEVNVAFVAALLTILGYSVNDTIVVFDRIRENLFKASSETPFEETVNTSVMQTLMRSINTAFTTLLALFAVFFFGGETIRDFVLALIVGLIAGTYSSIFIASPWLVSWHNFSNRKRSE